MEGWNHKDEWKKSGDNFLVVVSRHSAMADDFTGPNRWAVYAYIYPKHALFSKFDGPDLWQPTTTVMPLHAGCSYLRYHEDKGIITSVQVGCDYNHLHDEAFSYCATPEDAGDVFFDAERLFEFLTLNKEKQK